MRISARWVVLCYIVVIIFLHMFPVNSVVPSDQRRWNGFELDYLVHVLLFFPWMGLVMISKKKGDWLDKRSARFWIWLAAGLLIAAVAEFLQYFLRYRVFNPIDLTLNMSGVVLGAVFFTFLRKGSRRV